MKCLDCLAGDNSSKVIHTLGVLVGYIGATVAFLRVIWQSTPSEGLSILFLVYMVGMLSPEVLGRVLGARFGASKDNNGKNLEVPKTP